MPSSFIAATARSASAGTGATGTAARPHTIDGRGGASGAASASDDAVSKSKRPHPASAPKAKSHRPRMRRPYHRGDTDRARHVTTRGVTAPALAIEKLTVRYGKRV